MTVKLWDFLDVEKRAVILEKISSLDPHKAKAAQHFEIPEDQVTQEQRAVGKELNYMEWYT